jgi:hypothetical protein
MRGFAKEVKYDPNFKPTDLLKPVPPVDTTSLIKIPRHQEISQSDLAKLAAETRKRDIDNVLKKKK